ncbi:type II toxin-antitoxin system YafQ family toxin [Campylobacter sputorum]|nr:MULTISPECIES: type II toxin-antitoxin system YafQ family toxin [Campylobacter]
MNIKNAIRPDFLLIHRKENKILVLTLVDLGNHSELFS